MTRQELKDIINECLDERSYNESAEIINKKGIINFKQAFKVGAMLDNDTAKNLKLKFKNVDTGEDILTSFNSTANKAMIGKLQFGKSLTESKDYLLEFFGSSKQKDGTVKVGSYVLTVIGQTSKGYPVATCDKIKVQDKKVVLFSNENFSIFNTSVVNNIASLAKVTNDYFENLKSSACTVYRSKNAGSELTAKNLSTLTFVQGDMSKENNETYIDIYLEFDVTGSDEMKSLGVLVFYSFKDQNLYISPFKINK